MKDKKIQLPLKVQPFIKQMIEAEARHNRMKSPALLEQWALMHCVSPEAQRILLHYTEGSVLIQAAKAAEARVAFNDSPVDASRDIPGGGKLANKARRVPGSNS